MVEFMGRKVAKWIGLDDRYYLLIEYESDAGELKGEKYNEVLGLRDSIYPRVAKEGHTRIEDPKVLLDRFEKLLAWLEARGIPVFGHLGVGILHPCFSEEQEKLIPEMMHFVKRLGGQISGEHGVGLLKKEFVDPNDKKILVNVKKRTDVLNKFNEGKLV